MAMLFKTGGLLTAFGMAAGLVAPAPAAGPALAAVARIEAGQWQIKTAGSDAAARSLCIADPSVLLHFGRRAAACDHEIVTNDPDVASVQYRCEGGGSGRTTFHVATPRAFNLDLQGIDGGLPYDESYEAHRTGPCGAKPR